MMESFLYVIVTTLWNNFVTLLWNNFVTTLWNKWIRIFLFFKMDLFTLYMYTLDKKSMVDDKMEL